MKYKRLAIALSALIVAASSAMAQVKIGVLVSDYADISGKGSIVAAQMAVDDFGPVLGSSVQVVSADHQNNPDLASGIARRWYDIEGVDMIADGSSSGVALVVEDISRQKHKLVLFSGPASTDITGRKCSLYAAHWTYDLYALAQVAGHAIVKKGGKSWFFVGGDYAFGHALERDTAEAIKAEGGDLVGSIYAPLNTSDFSSFLLQARDSKAEVIGLANAGGDTENSIKQGAEFTLTHGSQEMAALFMFTTDIHAVGLETAQGVQFVSAFYWDKDDDTRAFSWRFLNSVGHMPTMIQAGIYSATLHYLGAVKSLGSKEGLRVMAKMREMPINDFMTHNGRLRIDGRVLRDMYLLRVKKPEESKGPWDYAKIIETVSGDRAFRPLKSGGCPVVDGRKNDALGEK